MFSTAVVTMTFNLYSFPLWSSLFVLNLWFGFVLWLLSMWADILCLLCLFLICTALLLFTSTNCIFNYTFTSWSRSSKSHATQQADPCKPLLPPSYISAALWLSKSSSILKLTNKKSISMLSHRFFPLKLDSKLKIRLNAGMTVGRNLNIKSEIFTGAQTFARACSSIVMSPNWNTAS